MKKLFSTLGMMALVSLCLFTSCKDEDVTAAPVVPPVIDAVVNNTQLQVADTQATATANAQAAESAKAAVEASGATVSDVQTTGGSTTTTYSDGTTVTEDTKNNKVTTTNPDGTSTEVIVEVGYTYTVDGVTYNSMDEVLAALKKKPAGSTATVVATLVETIKTTTYDQNGNKTGEKTDTQKKEGEETKVTVPKEGESSQTVIPHPTSIQTDTKQNVDVTITSTKNTHGGGAGRTN